MQETTDNNQPQIDLEALVHEAVSAAYEVFPARAFREWGFGWLTGLDQTLETAMEVQAEIFATHSFTVSTAPRTIGNGPAIESYRHAMRAARALTGLRMAGFMVEASGRFIESQASAAIKFAEAIGRPDVGALWQSQRQLFRK